MFHKARFVLAWRLVSPSGEVCDKGEVARDMLAADLRRADLTVHLPEVDRRTTCTLDLQLEADGKFVYGEARDIDVWPAPQAVAERPLARQVMLYDPSGKTAELLKREGVKFNTQDSIHEWNRTDANANWLFLIGEDVLTANAGDLAELEQFVDAGGNVLVPGAVKSRRRAAGQQHDPGTPRMGQPGLRAGEPPSDPEGRIESGPAFGRCLPRLSGPTATAKGNAAAGGQRLRIGLEWVELMEMYRGKGMYLLCQLPLVSKYDREPMARELLVRTVTYAAGERRTRNPPAA